MRLDKTQRPWAIASVGILAVSAIVYQIYALNSPKHPSGGSPLGLIFGILGFAFMLFAALLGARKRVPIWRLGRAQSWMRGHLWLGFLTLPLILFHGGFHFGGTLTQILMWLLILTVFSGVFGAALQNYVPRMMTNNIPLETIYDEIKNVRHLLRAEADQDVQSVCGDLGFPKETEERTIHGGGSTAVRSMATASPGGGTTVAAAPEILLLAEEERAPLSRFYRNEMRPYLERPNERRLVLGNAAKAQLAFSALRTLLPTAVHQTIDNLQDICDEARQLQKQERMHRWLHTWLLVHIPLSLALILLGAVHAVMALRY
jgi:hypothetical protein